MKNCTIYGCDAAAPRNSKVCFGHIKAGVLSNPLEVHFDRGAPSLSVTNNTNKEVNISATMYSNGGGWTLDRLISHEIDNEVLDNLVREANGLPPKRGYDGPLLPTPGKSYRIRYGNSLLGLTGIAYGVASGGTRLSLSKQVNSYPTNVEIGAYVEPCGVEAVWYPKPLGRLSFNPPYQEIYFPTLKEINER